MTDIHEIGDRIYRVNTPVTEIPGGFSFNQILVVDDEPLLFHTGPRRMFPLVREAVRGVIDGGEMEVVGEAANGAEAVVVAKEWKPECCQCAPCGTTGR